MCSILFKHKGFEYLYLNTREISSLMSGTADVHSLNGFDSSSHGHGWRHSQIG